MSDIAANGLGLERIFPGKSAMAAYLRAFDWSTTDLGAPTTWPQNLRTALGICLTAQLPMQIWWGPARTLFYNDACLLLLGVTNQPPLSRAEGEAWAKLVAQIGPQIEQVFTTGAANGPVASRLVFTADHSPQAMAVTFSLSPLLGENEAVEGVFGVCSETTALGASEEQLSAFVNATSDIVYEMSADWREMRFLKGKEFIATTENPSNDWTEAYIPIEEKPRVWATIQQAIATQRNFELEHRVIRLDGTVGWIFSRAIPLFDERGEIVKWFGAASDITERKHAEASLRRSEERLRHVLDGMGEGFGLLAPDFTILEHNREALRLDGRAREEIIGRSHWEVYPGTETSELGRLYKKAMAERVPVALEHLYAWAADRALWLEMRAYPTDDGSLAVFWRDVTDRREAQEALRQSEKKYRTIFDTIDEGFCILELIRDETGTSVGYRVSEVNQVFERQSGLKNAVGKRNSELAPGEEPYWLETYERVVRTGVSARFENYHAATKHWYDVYASRVGGDGSLQVAVVFDDVTDRKQRERNLAFLDNLQTELAPLATVEEITQAAGRHISEFFNISHCLFVEIDETAAIASVFYDSRADAPGNLVGDYTLRDFHTAAERTLLTRGDSVVIHNVRDGRTPEAAEAFAALGIRSLLTVSYLSGGRWKFALSAQNDQPRPWRTDEVELLRELVVRLYPRLERARAEAALRASEDKYRTLFESIDEGFCVLEILYDEGGEPWDCRYVQVNPAFLKQTGQDDPTGKLGSEYVPTTAPMWLATYDAVVRSGDPVRFEQFHPDSGRWYSVYASVIGERGSRLVASVFADITERKQREQQQEFLLKFSDALRTEQGADAVANRALEMLIEHLRLDRSYITTYDLEKDRADLAYQIGNDRVPPLPEYFVLSDYPEAFKSTFDKTLVIEDELERQGLSEAEKRNSGKLGMRAMVAATLRKENKPLWSMVAINSRPRRWTAGEIALVEAVAERTWTAIDRARAEEALRESEERQTFLLQLNDALRPLAGLAEIQSVASSLLVEYLCANRAMYLEIEGKGNAAEAVIRGQYAREAPLFPGRVPYADFAKGFPSEVLQSSETLVVDDTANDARLSESVRAAWLGTNVAAAVAVSLIKEGQMVANFGLHNAEPRQWTQLEIRLVAEVAERTWAAVERAKAEEALRESEEKYRTLFNSIDEAFFIIEVIYNEADEAVDYRLLEANPAFERATGIKNAVGKLGSEYSPDSERYWVESFDRVARTGESLRFENYHAETDRWYQCYYTRNGGVGSRQVAAVFDEITERKQREQQNDYLLKLSDALRPLADPVQIKWEAVHVLGEELGVNRALYAEVVGDNWWAERGYVRDVDPLPTGAYSSDTYGHWIMQTYRRGESLVFENVRVDRRFTEEQRAAAESASIIGAVGVPLVKSGNLVALLSVHAAEPHKWTAHDIAIVEATAERTWAAVERAKAEQALRESEEKYRTLFETIDEGFAVCELVRDAEGKASDYRILAVNLAFERHTGMKVAAVVGRLRSEYNPIPNEKAVALCAQVVETGEPVRFEYFNEGLKRWLDVGLFSRGGDQFSGVFTNITERKQNEEALRASEARIRIAVEAAQMATWEWHLRTGEIFWNEQHFLLFGMTPRTTPLTAADFFNHVHPDDREWLGATLQAAVDERQVFQAEFRSCQEDGSTRWMSGYGRVVAEEDGQVTQMSGVMFDVTERKAAEAALRESETRQAIILETMAEGVVTIDREGHFFSANEAAERILGVARSELIGQSINTPPYQRFDLDGTPWGDRPVLAEIAAAGQRIFQHDYVIERRDGSRVVVARNITAMHTSDGALLGFVSTLSDITEQKRAETALRDSEERFRAVANLVPDLLWSSEPDGFTSWYNQRWLEYTGQTLEQARGRGWTDAIHPDDRAASTRRYHEAVAAGKPLRQEHRIRQHTGVYRWFVVQAQPVQDEAGNILRWFGAATDIHEQRMARATLEQRVQERTQALEALSVSRQQLLERVITVQEDERRRIAHELHDTIGQFLSALNLRLSLLQQSVQPHEGLASPVVAELGQLWQLVNEIDSELRRLTMELRPPILDDLGLEEAIRRYVEAWSQTTAIPVDVYTAGMADERLAPTIELTIYRIVQEALTNVLKHAHASAVSVLLERRPKELQLIIEDNGVGFDPHAIGGQEAGRRTLGLIGMQERAALVGGRVDLETAPGAGTTLYVHIPYGPSPLMANKQGENG